MTQPLHRLTLIEAATAMAAGEFSTEQYVRELLDRIAATDANVQAWVHLDPEHALALARDADARREAGIDAAPLGGVPVGVKDVVATADQPTQLGSPIYAGACPPFDAECVSRLKRAGGIVLGKTVTTEFAFMQPAKTRNPWNAAHTPRRIIVGVGGGGGSGTGAGGNRHTDQRLGDPAGRVLRNRRLQAEQGRTTVQRSQSFQSDRRHPWTVGAHRERLRFARELSCRRRNARCS